MKKILLLLAFVSVSPLAFADPTTYTIDFEEYPEFTQITNQYAADDVTFTNALELVAPDYDYIDFPPHSGNGVITNDPNDPITLNFSTTMGDFIGWYADPNGIVVTAYDINNVVLGVYDGPAVIGADNEFVLENEGYAASLTISDAGGNADDLTVDDISYTTTPEPDSLILLGTGVLGLVGMMRRKLRR